MTTPMSPRAQQLRALIAAFIQTRLQDKIDKLPPDDPARAKWIAEYAPPQWLAAAAKRVAQIKLVTHTLKPLHPDARGSNLYCPPDRLPLVQHPLLPLVGSHCLDDGFAGDVVGNAAALDVHKFLKLSHDGRSLLELVKSGDDDLAAALSDDPAQAQEWMQAFAGIAESAAAPSSHSLAKQMYWPTRNDPHDDTAYCLLAPLFASSLTHEVYGRIRDARFGETAKAAREARRNQQYSEHPVHDYGPLAVQKFGGTKPQNISQLNSERHGENYLLQSLPPTWQLQSVRPLLHVDSLFRTYGRRPEVRALRTELLQWLRRDPSPNLATRQTRKRLVDELIEELLDYTLALRSLPAGWSQTPDCRLGNAQKRWLDPHAPATSAAAAAPATHQVADAAGLEPGEERLDDDDVQQHIAEGFARWLNQHLARHFVVDDDEFQEWRRNAREMIRQHQREHADVD